MASSILLVDDDSDALLSLVRALKAGGFSSQIHAAGTVQVARELQQKHRPNAVVLDLNLEPERGIESGFELLRELLAFDASTRVIVLTGHGALEYGIRSMREGAASFLQKPADVEHLRVLLEDAARQSELKRALLTLRADSSRETSQNLFGLSSEANERLTEEVLYAASVSQPLLITGETGTGKSRLAGLVHQLSDRREQPFISYQPTLSNQELVMSELFGHAKGAFTGADKEKDGFFESVDAGTLFLDEVDEFPQEVQVALLGVFQTREFRRIGDVRIRKSSARFVCAMNIAPEQAVASGKIRQDLFHRISHLQIQLPPLREQVEGIGPLALRILKESSKREGLHVSGIAEEVIACLKRHTWPGNIRELAAVVENAMYRAAYNERVVIGLDDLRLNEERLSGNTDSEARDFRTQVDNFQLQLIEDALSRNGGNQVKAADELQLDRSTMRRIIKRLSSAS